MVGMTPTLILAFVIATVVPLIALWIIRTLDLYGTGSFRTVLASAAWGVIAFAMAFGINRTMLQNNVVSQDTFVRFSAPIIEEILKSLILLWLVRRPSFTYFVDGAIYGFAAGIGFAIVEDYSYVLDHSTAAMGVAVARVLSTNLMHASASALIGIAIGWARFHKQPLKTFATLGGYAVAMGLHVGYNNLVSTPSISGIFLLVYAILTGVISAGVIAFAIRRGLAEEKAWIQETLGEADRVTEGEAKMVDNLERINKLLTPVSTKFGKEKAQQAQKFLTLQAQLGIRRKTLEKIADDKLRVGVMEEMDSIRNEMNEIRRSLGSYVMLYIRNIFPPEAESLFGDVVGSRIDDMKANRGANATNAFPAKPSGGQENESA